MSNASSNVAGHRATIAIFPGSFDPLTNGHLDLIIRGSHLVDHLIVAILNNSQKKPLFSAEERIEMISAATRSMDNVEVDSFAGLLIDYAARRGAQAILRGMRGIADYETERQMAHINRRLHPGTETIFLLAAEEHAFLSSRMIKEVITLGGDVQQFVPEPVLRLLQAKFPPTRP